MCSQQQFSHYPAWPAPVNVQLATPPDHPCVYLPDRMTRIRGLLVGEMSAQVHRAFMDAGFRRSGRLLYQPVCSACRQCVPIRMRVEEFQPSKSQRRALRRNADLQVTIAPPIATDEKFEIYQRYLLDWHGRATDAESREDFEAFLYDSPVETIEFTYRDVTGRLLAAAICDVGDAEFSSVYCYFDPQDAHRGLGTFAALCEIDFARSRRIAYYYLGYWIRGCSAMRYKANYRPCEFLGTDGIWRKVQPILDERMQQQ